MIMGPDDWLKKYEDAESKAWEEFFDQGDWIEEPKQFVVDMREEMRKKSIFYEIPY